MIPYGKHTINKQDIKSVMQVLKNHPLTQGKFVQKFENNFAMSPVPDATSIRFEFGDGLSQLIYLFFQIR